MTLLEAMIPHPPPLRTELDGTVRVGSSRVTLETVICAFKEGASPETIIDRYPSVSLADVYAVVAYYLWNRDAVETYLVSQQAAGASIRSSIEGQFPKTGLREKLLSRRTTKE